MKIISWWKTRETNQRGSIHDEHDHLYGGRMSALPMIVAGAIGVVAVVLEHRRETRTSFGVEKQTHKAFKPIDDHHEMQASLAQAERLHTRIVITQRDGRQRSGVPIRMSDTSLSFEVYQIDCHRVFLDTKGTHPCDIVKVQLDPKRWAIVPSTSR